MSPTEEGDFFIWSGLNVREKLGEILQRIPSDKSAYPRRAKSSKLYNAWHERKQPVLCWVAFKHLSTTITSRKGNGTSRFPTQIRTKYSYRRQHGCSALKIRFFVIRTDMKCKEGLIKKGKAVPLQAWSGPEGSSKLRFPDFMTTVQDSGMVVSLTHRPPLPPGNAPGTHFC